MLLLNVSRLLKLLRTEVWVCVQIAACMNLRKLALDFASAQLSSQPHVGALYHMALHLIKAGKCHYKLL